MAEHADVADVEPAFRSGNHALNGFVGAELVQEETNVLRSCGNIEVGLRRGGDVVGVDESPVGVFDDVGVLGMVDADD